MLAGYLLAAQLSCREWDVRRMMGHLNRCSPSCYKYSKLLPVAIRNNAELFNSQRVAILDYSVITGSGVIQIWVNF